MTSAAHNNSHAHLYVEILEDFLYTCFGTMAEKLEMILVGDAGVERCDKESEWWSVLGRGPVLLMPDTWRTAMLCQAS